MEEINIQDGVVADPRPIEVQEAKNWYHEEVAGAISLPWVEKPRSEWKKTAQRFQINSLSCVAQSSAKAMEVELGEVFSAYIIYMLRKNAPDGGMYLADAGDILKKFFTVLEKECKSQNLTEAEMNVKIDFTKFLNKYGIEGYFFCRNFDEVAQAIDMGKGVLMTFASNGQEWATETLKYLGTPTTFGHCICGTDKTLDGGVQKIIADDSAVVSGKRLITREFYEKRNTGAMYFVNPKKLDGKIHHTFTQILTQGMQNEEVRILQDVLKQDGCFPTGVNSTGFYGNATAHAVDTFQRKYQVAPIAELDVLQGKRVGQRTLAKLNELYGKIS